MVNVEPRKSMNFRRWKSQSARETDSRHIPIHSPISEWVKVSRSLVPWSVLSPEAENSRSSLASFVATEGVPPIVLNRALV